MIIDHAYNGHTQVAPDAKGDAEAQARQDGDDVPPGQAEAGAVHHRQLLLLHQLRTTLRRQLNSFSIWLPFLNQPDGRQKNMSSFWGRSEQNDAKDKILCIIMCCNEFDAFWSLNADLYT